ncbi:MAG: hypothetical protein H6930_04605 [Rhodoferax sp.]|nr:hypothetical protein [Rhodoferax sp.]
MRIGSAGVGSLDYMGTAMLQAQLGLALNVIPYKGMAPVLNDLRAGHIDACIVSPPTVRPHGAGRQGPVLAVLDAQRSALLPDVPSAKELGHPALMVGNGGALPVPQNGSGRRRVLAPGTDAGAVGPLRFCPHCKRRDSILRCLPAMHSPNSCTRT